MADIIEKVRAEFENIGSVVEELRAINDPSTLSALELAGAGAMLQSLYNGFENILKQMLKHHEEAVPSGPSWHRELLAKACTLGIISDDLRTRIRQYVAFRHFFGHAYAVHLNAERIAPLIAGASELAEAFREEIAKALRGAAGDAPWKDPERT